MKVDALSRADLQRIPELLGNAQAYYLSNGDLVVVFSSADAPEGMVGKLVLHLDYTRRRNLDGKRFQPVYVAVKSGKYVPATSVEDVKAFQPVVRV